MIATRGQTVRLQRVNVRDEKLFIPFRAFVRGYRPDELAGGIEQGESVVVISPTALAKAGISDPIKGNDRLWVAGTPRAVRMCNPVATDDVVVRWDAWIKGGV